MLKWSSMLQADMFTSFDNILNYSKWPEWFGGEIFILYYSHILGLLVTAYCFVLVHEEFAASVLITNCADKCYVVRHRLWIDYCDLQQ